ncbi:MAG TPA: right-handed parallel beta-helix repeat-containing protein [Bacillota bacterium]|nr:right-handed parallel beta-helix repeat-containing protein [Bacillota bacterium]
MNQLHRNRHLSVVLMLLFTLGVALLAPIQIGAKPNVEWKSIIFGQSTSEDNNKVIVDEKTKSVTLIAGSKDGNTVGGKVASSHDGISYYYIEVDPSKNFEISGKVRVNYFAKPYPDNQESFGIMARDAIGKHLDNTVFPSNMVLVGGYRGLIQSVFRNHVKDPSGAGAKMENMWKMGERPANDGTAVYELKLRKTNTGYHASVNNGPEKIYYRPKQLEVLNPDRIYVGFFAARVASITVTDIKVKFSDVATDEPGLPEPPEAVEPAVTVLSLAGSPVADYTFSLQPNAKGRLEITHNGKKIFDNPVEANQMVNTQTVLVKGNNSFDVLLTPDAVETITSTAPVRLRQTVTFKYYGKPGEPIYVSPTGKTNATGTETDPIDIYSAIQFIQTGQTIYVRGGVYELSAPIMIERGNNGTPEKLKVLAAYPGEKPVFDFGKKASGVFLNGDYWIISGIDITKSSGNGLRISGSHNVVELVRTFANGETGLQISGLASEPNTKWPAHNLILNCTSFDNRDPSENNADGFAAKLTCGPGNVFRGCIAYNNCDDGWDLYSKLETGPIGAVVIENCIAYGNGRMSDGYRTKGDGNGFKMGGEGLPVKHILRNSLAFNNETFGVTSNSDPVIIVENTTSVDNGRANFNFANYPNATPQFVAKNNISFRTKPGPADLVPEMLLSADNYFYNGSDSQNSKGVKLSAKDFKSVTPQPFVRNKDGSIARNDFMRVVKRSLKSGFRY